TPRARGTVCRRPGVLGPRPSAPRGFVRCPRAAVRFLRRRRAVVCRVRPWGVRSVPAPARRDPVSCAVGCPSPAPPFPVVDSLSHQRWWDRTVYRLSGVRKVLAGPNGVRLVSLAAPPGFGWGTTQVDREGAGPVAEQLRGARPGSLPRVSRRWTTLFTLVWLGLWMAWLVPIQLVLPAQLSTIDHADRVRDFGLINGAVGCVAIFALPIFGALCDRTRSGFGRRRVWVLGGVVVFALGLVLAGMQTSWLLLAACWIVAALGNSMMTAGLTAVIADQ